MTTRNADSAALTQMLGGRATRPPAIIADGYDIVAAGIPATLGDSIENLYSINNTTQQLNHAHRFVGFTGVLPPGAAVILQPADIVGGGTGVADGWLVTTSGNIGGDPGTGVARNPPPGSVVLCPGDVHDWGRTVNGVRWGLANGLAWSDNHLSMGHPLAIAGAAAEVVLRVWSESCRPPQSIGFRKVSRVGLQDSVPAGTEPGDSEVSAPSFSFDGAKSLTITIQDNVTTRTRVVGGESGSYEVWWLDRSGLWIHNDADDFDAAGRGAISSTHWCENYVLQGQVGVYLRKISGNDFYVRYSANWD